ncbi:MAG: chemotaxis protein CheC [Methanothermococcus sp.]|uniref:chemotaxis protein CheC n=1 Tax=Methanothermococcus sp. TaxID=2614238 RepID=UPI00258A3427|nr:chemotaxis protein CheC [Methanothermococcus sp.]MDK2790561.1 chemotaxis protein CheC [Methanothermococcus sp.]MDK2988053.1 chemotaxis protein CheC [Methanothermococcus sp.]
MGGFSQFSYRAWEVLLKYIIDDVTSRGEIMDDSYEKSKLIQNFSKETLNSIEEIGRSAAERAASFVEDMSGDKIEIKVFKVGLVTPKDIKERMGNDTKVFTKIKFDGIINGTGVLVFSEDSALKLSDAMLAGMGMDDESDDGEKFSEMKISAINETCNLLISAYVDTFANFMKTSLNMHPPSFVIGCGKELIDEIFKSYDVKDDDLVFTFESELFSHGIGAGFEVLIVIHHDSITTLFNEL